MPVLNTPDNPAPRRPRPAPARPFPDPATAILSFIASSCCCTFFQLALFLRWAWFGVACSATGHEATVKLRKAKSLVDKTVGPLVESGLISKVTPYLDTVESKSVCLFVGGPGSSLPDTLYDALLVNWNGHGGNDDVESFCLPQFAQQVDEMGLTRSETVTAEICRNDAMLAAPQSVKSTPELESALVNFKAWLTSKERLRQVETGTDPRPIKLPPLPSSVTAALGRGVESRWLAWPQLVEEDLGVGGASAAHAKRRIAVSRSCIGGQAHVVAAPMVAYWLKKKPKALKADRDALTAVLHEMLAECGRRGEILEIWAPSIRRKEK